MTLNFVHKHAIKKPRTGHMDIGAGRVIPLMLYGVIDKWSRVKVFDVARFNSCVGCKLHIYDCGLARSD